MRIPKPILLTIIAVLVLCLVPLGTAQAAPEVGPECTINIGRADQPLTVFVFAGPNPMSNDPTKPRSLLDGLVELRNNGWPLSTNVNSSGQPIHLDRSQMPLTVGAFSGDNQYNGVYGTLNVGHGGSLTLTTRSCGTIEVLRPNVIDITIDHR